RRARSLHTLSSNVRKRRRTDLSEKFFDAPPRRSSWREAVLASLRAAGPSRPCSLRCARPRGPSALATLAWTGRCPVRGCEREEERHGLTSEPLKSVMLVERDCRIVLRIYEHRKRRCFASKPSRRSIGQQCGTQTHPRKPQVDRQAAYPDCGKRGIT